MAIPKGGFRLHWDEEHLTPDRHTHIHHMFQDYANFADALDGAAIQYGMGHTLTRLENWLGEDASPIDQVMHVASHRHRRSRIEFERVKDRETMEASPLYGTF